VMEDINGRSSVFSTLHVPDVAGQRTTAPA
jgi:hypothetical protein